MNSISVIIPTYTAYKHLWICLDSFGKSVKKNDNVELVVVHDNKESVQFYNTINTFKKLYKHVSIKVVDFNKNCGLSTATNVGVYVATGTHILVVNDDNVFDKCWYTSMRDLLLHKEFERNTVIVPNQVEPTQSIFKQFVKADFGQTPEEFNYDKFIKFTETINTYKWDTSGWTLPFLMAKKDFMKVGGWDTSYPSGHVVDWDFFYKCKLNGYKSIRLYNTHFYHFGSVSSNKIKEVHGHDYFRFKWGEYCKSNPKTNEKFI